MGTVPDVIKKNVRAVLLSKVGGILVSDFSKDYKSLLREQLNFKQLGFQNLTELIKAIPDVVRLEFSDKDLAYKMFGKMDPNSSYTPLSAKLAAESSPNEKGDNRRGGRRNNKSYAGYGDVSNDDSGEYASFEPNMRGHYTLCYYREKECSDVTTEDLEQKYGEYPGLYEVHLIPRLIFVRYKIKRSAIQCLEKYRNEVGMRIANEKEPRKQSGGGRKNDDSIMGEKRSQNRDDSIMSKKKSDDRNGGVNEVYLGNLAQTVTENDLMELCAEFNPTDLRVRKKKDDPRKVFAFANFNDLHSAKRCVEKLSRMEFQGRAIETRLANKDVKPQNGEESSARSGGKVPWRSSGGQKAREPVVIEDDEESWDLPNPNNNTGQSSSGAGVSWKPVLNQDKSQPSPTGGSSFGQSGSSFGQNGFSFGQSGSSFGQSGSSFGQTGSSFGTSGQKSPLFGQNTDRNEQKSATGGKGTKKSDDQGRDRGQGSTGPCRGNSSDNPTIYFGNLHSSITKEVLEDMVKDYSPLEVRHRVDGPKIFGFVSVSSEDLANSCISRYNEMEVQGRKIRCNLSRNKPDKSSHGNQGRDRYEGIDSRSGSISTNDLNSKFGALTVQTDMSNYSISGPSPSARQKVVSQKNQSPQKPLSKFSKMNHQNRSPRKANEEDYSDMPTLELQPTVNGYSDMPPLEGPDEMPALEPVYGMEDDGLIKVWVANFPYFETESDLMEVFAPLGAVGITVTNSMNTTKTTGAIVDFLDEETAESAILETHQDVYKDRLLWVQIYEADPHKRNNAAGSVDLSISVRTGGQGSRSVSLNQRCLQRSPPEPNAQASGSHEMSTPAARSNRTFKSLLQTYKIIMNTLGTRVRDVVFKPYEEVMVYITSVFDDTSFWGTVVKDDSSLEALEEVLEQLQYQESRIGFTKGLGRCAALVNDEWQRGWVISSQRNDFSVEVFDVDSGRSSIVKKNKAFLTIPEIWEVLPTVRPFKIQEGTVNVDMDMEHALVNVQVTGTSVDDTGFLTQVKIMNVVETTEDED